MICVVATLPKAVIQKITNGDKVIGFQIVPNGKAGNAAAITRRSSLAECREIAETFYAKPAKVSQPVAV